MTKGKKGKPKGDGPKKPFNPWGAATKHTNKAYYAAPEYEGVDITKGFTARKAPEEEMNQEHFEGGEGLDEALQHDAEKAVIQGIRPEPRHTPAVRAPKPKGPAGYGVSEAKAGQQFKPGEASHEERQATRGTVSRMAHGAAHAVGQAAKKISAGATGMKPAFARSIECPHCGEGISKAYAIKSLAILAKSEGIDIGDELEQLVAEDEVEKGGKKRGLPVDDNKVNSHRGKAPGSFVKHPRTGGAQGVQRTNHPTNPVTEKSFRMPVIAGEPRLVQYGYGDDGIVAKSIEDGNLHVPPARNLRAEREEFTGEATE